MYFTESFLQQTKPAAVEVAIDDPLKNGCDFILALVLAVLTAPFIIVAALLVKLTSRGPAFDSELCKGQGGRLFRIYKLRTMRHEGEEPSNRREAEPLTPLGRLLRATHGDELPLLWNVLRGEMSMVGPRPEKPEFVTPLGKIFPYFEERFSVKPGFTGLAQVQAPDARDLVGARNKLALDLSYLELKSCGLDARILLAACLQVLGLGMTGCASLCRLPTKERAIMDYVLRILKETKPVGQIRNVYVRKGDLHRGWA